VLKGRIGIIAPEFPPDIGGVETYAYEFSMELWRRGYDVVVFTRPNAARKLDMHPFQVVAKLTLKYRSDRKLIKSHSVDVWHVMNAAYAWVALETEPVIVSVHGNDFISPYCLPTIGDLPSVYGLWRLHSQLDSLTAWLRRKMAVRLMWRGLARAKRVLANSEYTKTQLVRYGPACGPTTSVAFVGVGEDFLRVSRPTSRSNKAHFITVCRLAEPRKNVDKVLCALARLKEYQFEYTIVGDGCLRPKLEALSHELGLVDRVRFKGSLPKTQLQELLAASDLFILPSAQMADSIEGFGIAYLEANACGTPVLAAKTAGAAEAVNEGRSGYFVEEPTVASIAKALERFLKREIAFCETDCRAFASRFTWPTVVDRALTFYKLDNPAVC